MKRYKSFNDFWPHYVREHAKPSTRMLHFIGTSLILPLVYLGITTSSYWFLSIPLVAYGLAWTGHFFIERNRPATFQYPLWSLLGDFKMFAYMLQGKMAAEVTRCRELNSENT
ncbi:DUF962 domain-containing protein [Umboniibacter marinipuniceus]|uniref:DUF962 domain-containing protein n=1 Tax=Umboniibacter marinipuniceus TaxID=569599 RepID=A0A3L9ZXL1_9GAMM|nr:DUF962 domain-containing protein [Umboniibacter marinipuniceus]RMA77621.1 hypothetical protein DFR27_2440 [Umboniibacter marinipuniceus]